MTTHYGRSMFSQAVFAAVRSLYPESLADRSFDNTGVLLEAPAGSSTSGLQPAALLTIDLTRAVAEEAIAKRVSCVVAYHPIIFRALKSITLDNSQQTSLLRLAQHGISVYCPHTAVDSARGGNADWLADIITGSISQASKSANKQAWRDGPKPVESAEYEFHRWPKQSVPSDEVNNSKGLKIRTTALRHIRRPIIPHATPDSDNKTYKALTSSAAEVPGMGRLIHLAEAISLPELLGNLTNALRGPPTLSLALPSWHADANDKRTVEVANVLIDRIAVCAGSGGSVFNGIPSREDDTNCNGKPDHATDLLVTGELSHHEALAFAEQGKTVVCLGHSNSERGYLAQVMKPKLLGALQLELEGRGHTDASERQNVAIYISEEDTDPFGSWLRQ